MDLGDVRVVCIWNMSEFYVLRRCHGIMISGYVRALFIKDI